jgi:hypothetical protein
MQQYRINTVSENQQDSDGTQLALMTTLLSLGGILHLLRAKHG